ncbi:MAG: Flp family type IVb pilin [Aquabacterium sp.]
MKVLEQVKAFLKDEEGASGIEYALIAALVAGVLATLLADTNGIGARVNRILTNIKNALPAQ